MRPGLVIKGVLLGQVPLATGELVAEASISDMSAAYREQVKRENVLRPKAKQLRGMTSFSFKTLFKFAQLLNLVELVREEPMQFPPPGGPLYSIRKIDDVAQVVTSTRRIFKLTPVGAEDELSWTNLCKAWREDWPAPQKAVYVPVTAPPVRPPKVPVEKLEFVPVKWVPVPSLRQFKILAKHLRSYDAIGLADERVSKEVDRLEMRIGDWSLAIDDELEDARAVGYTEAIERLENWRSHIITVSEAIMDRNLPLAASSLEELA